MNRPVVQPYYYETASSLELHESLENRENLNVMAPGIRDSCSDTDSGICADSSSETQLSPKQLITAKSQLLLIPAPVTKVQTLPRPSGFKPEPNLPLGANNQNWKLRKNLQQSRSFHQSPALLPPDSGPQNGSNNLDFSPQKKCQPLRVRFADEVSRPNFGPGFDNICPSNHRQNFSAKSSDSKRYHNQENPRFPTTEGCKNGPSQSQQPAYYYCLGRNGQRTNGQGGPPAAHGNLNARQNYEEIRNAPEDDKTPNYPPPPPYFAAVERLQELKDRQNFFADNRNRSASLPRNLSRGCREFVASADNDGRKTSVRPERNYVENMRQRATNYVIHGRVLSSAKSVDNLHIRAAARNGANLKNGCVMPANSCSDIVHLSSQQGVVVPPPANRFRVDRPRNTTNSQSVPRFAHYVRRFATNALHKFGSDEHLGDRERRATKRPPQEPHNFPETDSTTYLADRKLRIRLLGLDCCGIQTLEIEKLEPGPFGFYIATGMFKRKKGIFISRVNARCLSQLISIGDQLLEIDAVSTKGKTLEQTQALIANKQKIVLKILPVIMR